MLDNVHLTCVTSLTQIIYKSQRPSLGEEGGEILTEIVNKLLGQGLGLGGDGQYWHSVPGDGVTQRLFPEEDLGVVQVLLPQAQVCLSKVKIKTSDQIKRQYTLLVFFLKL